MVYSNHNYVMLGEIVRRLRGASLEQVARERVFGPLGMDMAPYRLGAGGSEAGSGAGSGATA